MFKKFSCLLLILLMFVSVPVYAGDYELYTSDEEDLISFPVYDDDDDDGYTIDNDPNFIEFLPYTEGQQVYTLEPGKVFRFRFDYMKDIDLVFSDNVLYGIGINYDKLSTYDSYGNSYSGDITMPFSMYVYNCFDSEINITLNEGEIMDVTEYYSPFTLVMFDASEEVFKMKNISGVILPYKVHYYNEDDGSININTGTPVLSGTKTLEGKGVLMFEFSEDDLPYKLELNGVYEISEYVESDFFQVPPPWILKKMMNLTELLGAFLKQLKTLLPVALVMLSVFLLISLLIYTVRLFL